MNTTPMTPSSAPNWFPTQGEPPAQPAGGKVRNRVIRASDVEPKPPVSEQSTPTLMRVFEVIRQIYDAGGEPTRERIAEISGLKLTTVDDRIKELRREGYISPQKQSYRPTQVHAPARACSVTFMPDGMTKIELGDYVMMMVPAEAREMGLALQGKALEATALQAHHTLNAALVEIATKLRRVEQDLAASRAALAGKGSGAGQLPLLA